MNGFSRSAAEWRLLARGLVIMTGAVVFTRTLPFAAWKSLGLRIARVRPAPNAEGPRISPVQIVRAVDSASRVVPGGGNCLARALTGRALMARHGYASELVMGVAKGSGPLRSHVWLRHKGDMLLGAQGVSGFEPMPDLADRL
jgi:hypothetical protein